jgi:hypothetical protein
MAGHAAVLQVPDEYPTIQSAIDAAATGDEVLVAAGTYFENLAIEHKVVDVVSVAGPRATIVDGRGRGSVVTIYLDDRVDAPASPDSRCATDWRTTAAASTTWAANRSSRT